MANLPKVSIPDDAEIIDVDEMNVGKHGEGMLVTYRKSGETKKIVLRMKSAPGNIKEG